MDREQRPFWRKIPGFRSGKRWKMVVAAILYSLVVVLCLIPSEKPKLGITRKEAIDFFSQSGIGFTLEEQKGVNPRVIGRSRDKLAFFVIGGSEENIEWISMAVGVPKRLPSAALKNVQCVLDMLDKFAPGSYDWSVQEIKKVRDDVDVVSSSKTFSSRKVRIETSGTLGLIDVTIMPAD
ncbi:MAG: hypothetical protein D4R73_11765 [Deltaproteobacteria bacterium]|nr:MAG: hypothetical protein D4R73_11765 [Deltaproteobacteria bacterium]